MSYDVERFERDYVAALGSESNQATAGKLALTFKTTDSPPSLAMAVSTLVLGMLVGSAPPELRLSVQPLVLAALEKVIDEAGRVADEGDEDAPATH